MHTSVSYVFTGKICFNESRYVSLAKHQLIFLDKQIRLFKSKSKSKCVGICLHSFFEVFACNKKSYVFKFYNHFRSAWQAIRAFIQGAVLDS